MAHLLIADDQASELDHLESVLSTEGHRCARARDGAEALKRWRNDRHDLVILDVRMPGMDGIKATQRLKAAAQADNAYVPVLVVTGLDDVENRLEAFDAGADDFLSKPVEDWELRARVRTFLHIAHQQRATEEAFRKLREVQSMRDELMQLIVHDLKNPLAAISSNLEYIESRMRDDREGLEALADCRDSTARLLRMVTVLLDVNRLEEGHIQPNLAKHGARAILEASRRGRAHEAKSGGILVEVDAPPSLEVRLDADLLGRVLDNLIDNALRYTGRGGLIRLSAGPGPLGARIAVFNSGPSIPEKERERIFQKYERIAGAKSARGNRGIGLYFCRLAARAHGGDIFVDDGDGTGCRFVIDLPR